MTRSTNSDDAILLARIGAAHGVNGELRVKPFGEAHLLDSYGPLHDKQGNGFTIVTMRPQKNMLVIRFAEVNGREAAEKLNGVELFVSRKVLPQTSEDEFYLNDLIGLLAVSPKGETIGIVTAVDNFGAGDIVEIKFDGGKKELFAFTRECFPEIDLEAEQLVFNKPETVSERDKDKKQAPEANS